MHCCRTKKRECAPSPSLSLRAFIIFVGNQHHHRNLILGPQPFPSYNKHQPTLLLFAMRRCRPKQRQCAPSLSSCAIAATAIAVSSSVAGIWQRRMVYVKLLRYLLQQWFMIRHPPSIYKLNSLIQTIFNDFKFNSNHWEVRIDSIERWPVFGLEKKNRAETEKSYLSRNEEKPSCRLGRKVVWRDVGATSEHKRV